MKIGEIGEFGLIERLTRSPSGPRVRVGVGDDAAVLDLDGEFLLYTTDLLVEGDHFRRDWSTPLQIGRKAMASNVSDIAAMGGRPHEALVSVAIPDDVDVEFMDDLYEGMYQIADKYGAEIVGGDTTHGALLIINIALLGHVDEEMLSLRSDAKVDDLICVTGPLGGSRAGLELLLRGFDVPEEPIRKHLDPGCRMDIAPLIAEHVNAMIDVSDGLAPEIRHICERSGVGAEVRRDSIPLLEGTRIAAERVGGDPYGFALGGGEDFELVFTIPEERLSRVIEWAYVLGRIVPAEQGIHLIDSERMPMKGGYDHFRGWRPDT